MKSHLTAVFGIALALSAGPAVLGATALSTTALSEAAGSTAAEFEALLQSLARAWSEQNTPAALACFTPDALSSWREYFVPGPASFSDFVGVEGKTWKWTAKTVR